ncbi:MAG: VOC family protein [Rudaea sp.]
MKFKTVPDGYHSVSAYLHVADAKAAIDFYARAFGAVEIMRLAMADGRLGHAEVEIGDTRLMLADEAPAFNIRGPAALGGASTHFKIYVPDVDAAMRRALDAGAKQVRPAEDQFYGERSGTVVDPFGHQWTLSARIEDVSIEEMQRRLRALSKTE